MPKSKQMTVPRSGNNPIPGAADGKNIIEGEFREVGATDIEL